MARLSKPALLHVFESSIREAGWNFLHLSPRGEHPARYQVYQGEKSFRVKVYIWNLTPGGQNRPEDEWRIQITGVDEFVPEPGARTVLLGWWDDVSVFAGFDIRRHLGPFGASPSIQLREPALRQAVVSGFSPHNKGNGELAIAFRPDFLGSYVEHLDALHDSGEVPGEVAVLERIGEAPERVAEEEIDREIAAPRRYAITSARRALRELDFRDRVLTAYGHRCALCGIQLKLLDGAHILPVAHPDSTDQTANGVSLCALHHRAYDRALVTFAPDYRVQVNEEMVTELSNAGHDGGLASFRDGLRPIIHLPPDRRDRPDEGFVRLANELRGWP